MQYDPQTLQELFRIINSPAGRQLITMLQENGGSDLQNAVNKAEQGNYDDAKKEISSLLNDPQIKNLLKQLGR